MSGIARIEGSEGVLPWNMASASRWRDGDEGAVNWKTAGAESATLREHLLQLRFLSQVHPDENSRNSVRDNGVIHVVSRVLVFGSLLVQT